MEVYKQQVAELSKKLQNLQTQNETLEERNRLLEKVVQLKDKKSPAMEEPQPVRLPIPHCMHYSAARSGLQSD